MTDDVGVGALLWLLLWVPALIVRWVERRRVSRNEPPPMKRSGRGELWVQDVPFPELFDDENEEEDSEL